MTAATATHSNPLDPLVLRVVLGWVSVVFRQRKKCGWLDPETGRPWTRLPAKDIAEQLERESGLAVSVRRIQRSLERLADSGHLARFQRLKRWGTRDFWYSWADKEWGLHQHRPTAVSRKQSATLATDDSRRPQESAVTLQYSTGSDSSSSSSSPKPPNHRPVDGKNRESGVEGFGGASRGSSPKRGQMALQRLLEGAVGRLTGSKGGVTPNVQSNEPAEAERTVSKVGRYLVVEDPITAFTR